MVKKILFVIDRLNEGAGRVVYGIVKNLNRSIFDPVIASIYRGGNLVDEFDRLDVKIINLNKKDGKDLSLILRIKRIIDKEKIDIVHTHNVDAYEYGILAAWLAGVKRIVHTSHGKSVKIGKFNRKRENLFHKFVSLFLDKYIVVSNDLGKYVNKNWCLNKRKIKLIYNGIDVNKYKGIKVNRRFLNKFGVSKKDKLVGIVAGLRPVKDHITLIKAMDFVNKEVPNSKLLVIGDGPEKEKLINFVKESGLGKNVLFLENRKDVVELFNCVDVGVLCSLSECLSITLLEGMACGVPFVATRVGGNPEVIDNGETGFLISARDSQILAERILELLKNKKLINNMGKKAREKVIKGFNVNNMVKEYERSYNG